MTRLKVEINSEYLECPICMKIPEKEIFQCVNGHITCHLCYVNLEVCPECRTSIGGEKRSRNLIMEKLLDQLKFDCPHAEEGCEEKLQRKDLSKHGATCKYGEMIELCKLLGFTDCALKVYLAKVAKIIPGHLQQVHGCANSYMPNRFLTWEHFCQLDHPRRMQPKCYLFQLENGANIILLVCKILQDHASWTCFQIDGSVSSSKQLIEISCVGESMMEFKIPVVPVREVEQVLRELPFKVSVPYLSRLHTASNTKPDLPLIFSAKVLPKAASVLTAMRPVKDYLYYDNSDPTAEGVVNVPIGRGLFPGVMLRIQGKVLKDTEYFRVYLKTSHATMDSKQDCNVSLRIYCGFNPETIGWNCYTRKLGWGKGERDNTKLPLCPGKEFDMEILCEVNNGYSVKINGKDCFQYQSPIIMAYVTYLEVANVKVSLITVHQ